MPGVVKVSPLTDPLVPPLDGLPLSVDVTLLKTGVRSGFNDFINSFGDTFPVNDPSLYLIDCKSAGTFASAFICGLKFKLMPKVEPILKNICPHVGLLGSFESA